MKFRTTFLSLFLLGVGCSTGGTTEDGGSRDFDAFIPSEGGVACTTDRDCDDRVACTIDRCREAGCDNSPCLDCCEEGLVCTVGFGCREEPETCEADADCQDAVRCTLDFCGDDGVCRHDANPELCARGEICLPAVGCIPEPPTECETPEDCRVAACVGEWSCQPEFGCQFVSELDCDDGDACTVDGCTEEAGGCFHDPLDADADGHSPIDCGGDDCDDADGAVSPSAMEICDEDDNDCDGQTDEGCCTPDMACTTSCGTSGLTVCEDGESRCVAPEVCNGVNDDCDDEIDEDFDCPQGTVESCDVSCGVGTRACSATCTWEACEAPDEICNGVDDDCDGPADEDFDCVRGESSPCTTTCGSEGTRACLSSCTLDSVCVPPAETCNGVDDNCNLRADEGFTCVQGATVDCATLSGRGWTGGVATCREDCSGYDESGCDRCGDGVVQTGDGEECDGSTSSGLQGLSCRTLSSTYTSYPDFGGGTLGCTADCTFDLSGCSYCGNGTVEPGEGETCDGSSGALLCATIFPAEYTDGTLDCFGPGTAGGLECTFDTSGCCAADRACTTICGTPGRTQCTDGVSECVAEEICNGIDDDCDGTRDEGFECRQSATESCDVSCGTGTRACSESCEWLACEPPMEVCNGVDDDCDEKPDEDFDCVRGESSPCTTTCGSAGTRACLSNCTLDSVCVPPAEVCNGVDDNCNAAADETFACVQGETVDCSTLTGRGWFGGVATCRDDCSGYDESECDRCGDGVVQTGDGEECDGSTPMGLQGLSCGTLNDSYASYPDFGSGVLGCNEDCTFDVSGCSYCGNGFVDAGQGEACDGATGGLLCADVYPSEYTDGELGCYGPGAAEECTYDRSGCSGGSFDPSGTYDLDPVVVYACADFGFGPLVNLNVSSLDFADNGTTLSVFGTFCGPSAAMTGSSASDGSFNVCCTYAGTCAETYCLSGTFTDEDNWSGTFTAAYSGSCFDCTSQERTTSGTRRGSSSL